MDVHLEFSDAALAGVLLTLSTASSVGDLLVLSIAFFNRVLFYLLTSSSVGVLLELNTSSYFDVLYK